MYIKSQQQINIKNNIIPRIYINSFTQVGFQQTTYLLQSFELRQHQFQIQEHLLILHICKLLSAHGGRIGASPCVRPISISGE